MSGRDLAGVHVLRTRGQSDAIRAAATTARHVVVVGGGWIASELAATIRQLGGEVTIVSPTEVPLQKHLGREVGTVYRDLHAEHGVEIVAGRRVVGFEGRTAVERALLDDGTAIAADLAVVGAGAIPRLDLAREAGLGIGDGVIVDAFLETDVPGIYAAGDIAAAWHPVLETRIRVEHWDNARRQGRTAARNMLGLASPTTGCRTCSRISTTSGWSTPAMRRNGIGWSSGATRRDARSWPSGSTATVWPRA